MTAIWRGSNGSWYIVQSNDGQYAEQAWGVGYAPHQDVPVAGDYDGDGQADLAVWRNGDATWYLSLSGPDTASITRVIKLGESSDKPISTRQ